MTLTGNFGWAPLARLIGRCDLEDGTAEGIRDGGSDQGDRKTQVETEVAEGDGAWAGPETSSPSEEFAVRWLP